jgi:hypothetical protein
MSDKFAGLPYDQQGFAGLPVVPGGGARYSAASAPTTKAPASFGQCIIHTVWILGCKHLEIVRADERVRIAAEVLAAAEDHPDVSYGDGILTIRGINRTVSYGIGPYDLLTHTHEARLSPGPPIKSVSQT